MIEDSAVYKSIFDECCSDLIFVVTKDNFTIEECNLAARKFFSVSNDNILSENILEFFAKKGVQPPISFNYNDESLEVQIPYAKAQKEKYTHELYWKIRPMLGHDNIKKIVMLARVDEHREVKFFNQNIFQLLDSIPGSVYWKGLDGKYLGCNKFMLQEAGFSSAREIIGKTDFDLWPQQADKIRENDRHVIESTEAMLLEERVDVPGKETMYFSSAKIPLTESGKVIGVIGNSVPITELKKTSLELAEAQKRLEEVNEVKKEFIRNMSHDIRTPFTGILEIAKHMLEKETDATKRMELGFIVESSNKLLGFFNRILHILQLEDPNIIARMVEFSVVQLVLEAKSVMDAAAHAKGLEMKLDISGDIPENLKGEPIRFTQIIMSLLGNAIKFTDKGYIAINLHKVNDTEDSVVLKLVIEDTGRGIPSNKHDFIFEKFNRITDTHARETSGMGLGLNIVKQSVESLGGEVGVQSVLGKGSSFICLLPFQKMVSGVAGDGNSE